MKKFIVVVFSLLFAISVLAETKYVASGRINVYKSPMKSSKKVLTLKKGTKVNVKKVKNGWYYLNKKKGYVHGLFLSKKKPGKRISLLGRATNNARVHARKRASSDVTAASARGLLADRTKKNNRYRDINIKDVETDLRYIEGFYISEVVLVNFMKGIK